jgi:hypothetical protein
VLRIIKECELPCVMDSGPYGGLSMAVYDHIVAPGQYPDCLIVLDQDHVINKAKTWDQCFEFLSQFTHNDRNRELADMYRLPKPEPKRRYEY